jgi:fructose/tagatose bisphosphate aldolase
MQKLREVLEQTQKNETAVGHFNVSDLVLLKGGIRRREGA